MLTRISSRRIPLLVTGIRAMGIHSQFEERFDSSTLMKLKIQKLANLIINSKYAVAYTGAGISTAAGIPDYFSGKDTVVETGPGKVASKVMPEISLEDFSKEETSFKRVNWERAEPTFAHRAVKLLMDHGHIKHIITQTEDGLHRKTGLSSNQISELHGNVFVEVCKGCDIEYVRDFECRNEVHPNYIHLTGRTCDKCGKELEDTMVNFGEEIPAKVYLAA